MDPELSNFAEWGGAAAPKEPQTPIKSAAIRKSPGRPFTPSKPPLNALPEKGANKTPTHPLPARPNVYSKRESPQKTGPPRLQYSAVVKNNSHHSEAPRGPAAFKSNKAPKQKDHLKPADFPSPQIHRNESRSRNHFRKPSAPRTPNGSTSAGPSVKPKTDRFASVHPRNLAEEERNDMREGIAKEAAQFTDPLEPSISLPFELWFFWPDGAVDIEKLKSDYDRDLLREVRSRYHCRIAFDVPGKIVRCSTEKEGDLELLQDRLLGLYREFTSRKNDLNVINFFNIPTFKNYSDWINVPVKAAKDSAKKGPAGGTARLVKPELDEERPASHRHDEVYRQRFKSLRANNRLMRKAIEACIKELRLTEERVYMRLRIGEMFLSRYRNAANMKPVSNAHVGEADQRYYQYSLDEFEDMISEELAEMELRNIPSNHLDYENLIAKISLSNVFTAPEESYTVDFDFVQPDSKHVLRLVVDYSPSHTAGEVEVSQSHWLEVPPNEKYLALNVLDFEDYDVQFLITAFKRCTNPVILSQLGEFERSVTFTPPKHGHRSEVRRRSRFAHSTRFPDGVCEKSVITYSIKDSNLKFELARYDTFENPASLPFLKTAQEPSSEWSFALYDPEWDTKLGELAYLEAGQEVTWPRTLRTFFRGVKGEATSKEGFKKFVADVEMVTKFLSEISREERN